MQSSSESIRKALHAGSWYEASAAALNKTLSGYMKAAQVTIPEGAKLKALIGPHAGFAYSGPCAAWAYQNLAARAADFDRVVILGPSHKIYLDFIGTTACEEWETPLGNLKVDMKAVEELVAKSDEKKDVEFVQIQKKYEENEHSLEMHLPYIQKVFKDAGREKEIQILPLMVGQLPEKKYAAYAKVLLPYFMDPRTVFVVSTDFCHWGKRFDFTHQFKDEPVIHKSIEKLDRQGMEQIEKQNKAGFVKYLKETENTICGRNPCQLLLAIIEEAKKESGADSYETKFVQYDQSENITKKSESSVSYASSYTIFKE